MSTEAFLYRDKNNNMREIRRKRNHNIIKRRLHYWQYGVGDSGRQKKIVLNNPCHCSKRCCAVQKHRKGKGISTIRRLYSVMDFFDFDNMEYI